MTTELYLLPGLKKWTTRWDLMWSRICLPFRNNWEHPVSVGYVMLSLYFSVVFSVLLFVCLSFFLYIHYVVSLFSTYGFKCPFGSHESVTVNCTWLIKIRLYRYIYTTENKVFSLTDLTNLHWTCSVFVKTNIINWEYLRKQRLPKK